MFKKAVLVVLQTVLFLALFAVGSFLPALPSFASLYWQVQTSPGHVFVLDGVVLMLGVYLLILIGEAAAKRVRGAGGLTTLSVLLALLLGLAMQLGFKSV